MELSRSVIQQFVNVTNDDGKTKPGDNTAFGEIVQVGVKTYAKIDGSSQLTPVSTTARVKVGDRVVVTLKNHTATVIGNTTDPSASSAQVEEISGNVTRFETIIADKASIGELEAQIARIVELEAEYATIDTLVADNASIKELLAGTITAEEIAARYASIEYLEANFATFYELEGNYATIGDLSAANAKINALDANYATIGDLYATKGEVTALDTKYANIDFSNIDKSTMEYFYANSGLIRDVVINNGNITGHLVGVTITGDLIEGNTIKADKLVVLGEDGLYYKLNVQNGNFLDAEDVPTDSLHGSIITAKSITADKVQVSDLVAFGATIGGFNLTKNSIYSGVKESVDNGTRGVYLDNAGQVAFGDAGNYIKYYRDRTGSYKLEIAADSLVIGSGRKSIEETVSDAVGEIQVGARNLIVNSKNLIYDEYYFTGTIVAVHDGTGNVTIVRGATSTYNEVTKDLAIETSSVVSHDGEGNVVLS